jgi:undecaprenyl-diphosphatase
MLYFGHGILVQSSLFMDILSGIILGFVQGITEFLPVSSSGHLIIAHTVLGFETTSSLAFDAVLQLATALAVIVYFFDEIFILVQTTLRKLGRLPVNEKDFIVVKAIGIGTIPAIILGLLLESQMEHAFRNPILVAIVLILGSVFFMYAEYVYQNNFHTGEIDIKTGFKIGLFQTFALIPGFSRSGATIAGGMLLGLNRNDAARFSFLLALPIILGSGLKKLLDLLSSQEVFSWTPLIFGAATAFAVGLCAIHFMITFVKKHTLWPFIWYRITLAAFVLFIAFFG